MSTRSWQRWIARASGGDAAEDRAARLFRRASPPPALTAQARQRVRERLVREPRRWPRRRLVPASRWAIVVSVLLGSGAVIAARGVDRWWTARRDATVNATSVEERVRAPVRRGSARLERPAPSSLAAETRLLDVAVTRLRRHGDAEGALRRLDEYHARFPTGALAAEAAMARVDALLLLGRNADALTALNGLALSESGRERELLVIRGELRGASPGGHGRPSGCPQAIADFDGVLRAPAAPIPAALLERALYGRAVCRWREGEAVLARRDADAYLRRFPSGRFTREARQIREQARSAAKTGDEPSMSDR